MGLIILPDTAWSAFMLAQFMLGEARRGKSVGVVCSGVVVGKHTRQSMHPVNTAKQQNRNIGVLDLVSCMSLDSTVFHNTCSKIP